MSRALVAGHAEFAAGMISAITQITGREDVFVGLTNRGLSADGVRSAMDALVAEHGLLVIFTDLPAGSCTIAARRLLRERPALTLVVGANLGALLDFAFREDVSPREAATEAAERGRAALTVVG